MPKTLDEVRRDAMELSDEDRSRLSEELARARWAPGVLESWIAESERTIEAMKRGEEPVLTLEEFWQDDDEDE